MELTHALVTGLLCGGAYWGIKKAGWLDNKSAGQRFLIILPAIFVIVLVKNLVWPAS